MTSISIVFGYQFLSINYVWYNLDFENTEWNINFSPVSLLDPGLLLGNLRTTTTTGSGLQCTAQARLVNFVVVVFNRRGVVDDAKQSRITSSCNPQASAGINPLF